MIRRLQKGKGTYKFMVYDNNFDTFLSATRRRYIFADVRPFAGLSVDLVDVHFSSILNLVMMSMIIVMNRLIQLHPRWLSY